jgi:hypothetical protein
MKVGERRCVGKKGRGRVGGSDCGDIDDDVDEDDERW